MSHFLTVENLTFIYESAIDPLFQSISFQLEKGWTGLVGPNGCGKTTLLQLICSELTPSTGSITSGFNPIYCEQRTDNPPAIDPSNYLLNRYLAQLSCQPEWLDRWNLLSHGERKRCQLAIALSQEPDILAIDEPTNHLDHQTKNIVIQTLQDFNNIGIIVSHDREVLDTLCSHTLFIQEQQIRIQHCSYSQAAAEIERDIQRQNADFFQQQTEIKKLKKRVTTQRQKADTADKRRSKRGIHKKDHDAKAKIDMARLSGSDGNDGKLHRQLKSKLNQAEKKKSQLSFTKEYNLGIHIDAAANGRWFPITLQPFDLHLGNEKQLIVPDLSIQHNEKIGLVGENGAGKSTFIKALLDKLKIPKNSIVYLAQEINRQQTVELLARIKRFDSQQKGFLFSIIRRLGSDPKHLLTTETPSPGETRKLLLAEGLLSKPALIIMDEPTNHMDLPSIESLESALNECACSQLLVSHDNTFLQHIVSSFWMFQQIDRNQFKIREKSNQA